MASYNSSSSRRSHMSHQPPETVVWTLPNVQGPPSALYATYFNGYGPPNPYMTHHSPRHYSSSTRAPVYPGPIPHPHSRRGSTGNGPRVFPQYIDPPHSGHAHYHSHSRSSHVQPHYSHSQSQPKLVTRSILKNGTKVAPPPPQSSYVLPRGSGARRSRAFSFSGMRDFLVKPRSPTVPPSPPATNPPRQVRFVLPKDNEPYRRR